MSNPPNPRSVTIIAGGFAGAAVVALLFDGGSPLPGARVVVAEPRGLIGRCLAYGAPDPADRIDVPAGKMMLLPEGPDDANRVLENLARAGHPHQASTIKSRNCCFRDLVCPVRMSSFARPSGSARSAAVVAMAAT